MSAPGPRQVIWANPQEIAHALRIFYPEPGTVIEMRIPWGGVYKRTDSGYFSDLETLAGTLFVADQQNARSAFDAHAEGIYVTLNPVKPELGARAANKLQRAVKYTTADADILHRTRLLLDIDAVRPAGISSTDGEHEQAIELARTIAFELGEDGWPAPILCDSGNSAYLVYAIDLANDEASAQLAKQVLGGLAKRFNNPHATIDPKVFNAARIFKAMGTVARKGDDVPDRPWRVSKVLSAPQRFDTVARGLLEETALKNPQPSFVAAPSGLTDFDIPAWLAKHQLTADGPFPYQGALKWVLTCPFDDTHKDAAIFQSNGRITFSCFHNSCKGKTWKEFRRLLEGDGDAIIEPADLVVRYHPKLHFSKAVDMYELSIACPELLIEQILPRRGALLLYGMQKAGKTVLAVQIALAILRGKPLFDYYRVHEPGMIMIVEQDDPDGTASIREILKKAGINPEQEIHFIPRDDAAVLGPGYFEWLEAEIQTHSLRVIVLDSYTTLRPLRKRSGDIVKLDQMEIGILDELGKRANCLIILLHHDSHGGANRDWSAKAGGTYGLTLATEAQMYVSKFPELLEANERLVRLQGRHLATHQMLLRYRPETEDYVFVLNGPAAPLWPIVQQIQAHFPPRQVIPIKELAPVIGGARATVFRYISQLLQANVLLKHRHGEYSLQKLI